MDALLQRMEAFPAVKQVFTSVKADYFAQLTKRTALIDAFIAFSFLTALIQAVYRVLVGTFPFNSFLSGFICALGACVLAVSLRLQVSPRSEFKHRSPERAFTDFVVCNLILFLAVFSFMG